MKPEDIVSDALAGLLNACPHLGQVWLDTIFPYKSYIFSPRAGRARFFQSNPDIILWDTADNPRVYVEAKVSAKTQPLQLLRARNSIRQQCGSNDFKLVLLCTRRDSFPAGLAYEQHMHWFDRITWRELIELFRSHSTSPNEARAIIEFEMTAHANGALERDRPQKQTSMLAPSGHDYGSMFAALKARSLERRAIGSYGAGISPVLFLGLDKWRQSLRSPAVERIALFYHLPKYKSPERYAFQVWLWDDNIFPVSNIRPERRAQQLQALSKILLGRWEIGSRKGGRRPSGSRNDPLPVDAGGHLVGLVTTESLYVNPPYVSEHEVAQLLDQSVSTIETALTEVLVNG